MAHLLLLKCLPGKLSDLETESPKGRNLEDTGVEERPPCGLSSHSNDTCGLLHYLARAEHLESIFLFFLSELSDAAALIILYNMHHLS